MKLRSLLCLLAALVMAFAMPQPSAEAQDGANSGEESFQTLVAAGVRAYEEENYNLAIDKFMAALVIEYQADLLYNIARCHDKNRNCHQAQRYYQKYINHAEANPQVAQKAQEHLAALGECPATTPIAMVCTPSDALVTFTSTRDPDTKPFQKELCSEGVFALEPDTYNLVVEAPGYQTEIRQLTVTRSENTPQNIRLTTAGSVPGTPGTPVVSAGPNWLAWSLIGAGGALVTSAIVVDIVNLGVRSDLEETPQDGSDARQELEDEFTLNQTLILTLGSVGLVSAVTGLVFLLTGVGERAPEPVDESMGAVWSLTPSVTPRGDVGAVFTLTF